MLRQKGNQAVAEALKKEGVKYVFGLPGGHSCNILYDALHGQSEITPILARHEAAGAFAAYGYAQATGKVAFCHGTAGPGWAQMLPGVHEAWASRTPMIAFAASAPSKTAGMGAIQEFPQKESMIPFCKWVYDVDRVDKIPWIMQRAFTYALSNPPGPVGINFPMDLGTEEAEMPPYRLSHKVRSAGDPGDVGKVVKLLTSANEPVLIAGRGVHMAAAWKELQQLAELLAIPVLTTNGGKGAIPETHPLYAGGVGINLISVSERIYENCDCMVWIGSQIEEFAAGAWDPIPSGRKFVHIDADPTQFGRNWNPDVAIAGDAKLVLAQLTAACKESVQQGNYKKSSRVKLLQELWKQYEADVKKIITKKHSPVHPLQVVKEVESQMDDDAVIVLGEGANRVWTASQMKIRTAGNWVSSSDYGCMGLSVPAAIGAKLGKPESQVIAITGDGSFQMQMQELPVALDHKTPVTWVVMNNNCLGWIKWWQTNFLGGRTVATEYNHNWRFDKVAEAAGCVGIRVDKSADLKQAMGDALAANKEGIPAVVDVLIPEMEQTEHFGPHHGLKK